MNKRLVILGSAGACGTTTLAIGLGAIQTFQKKDESKKLKSKYSSALLSAKDAQFLNARNALFSYLKPTHPILIRAYSEYRSNSEKSKLLHREGCENIYESEDEKYLDDFKKFCSKSNKDGISEKWIQEEPTESKGKWDDKLTKLKNYNGELIPEFFTIKESLRDDNFGKAKRTEIKKVCDDIDVKIYMGEENLTTKNARSFCLDN